MSDLERAFEMHLRVKGLAGYQKEFRFHDKRKWRFDYAWPHLGVAVELEGGAWLSGRNLRGHTGGAGFEKDCEKYAEAALLGWIVLRFTRNMIEDGRAIRYTEGVLRKVAEATLAAEQAKSIVSKFN
jgi:very-short-patch-repair endonuclease